MPKVSRGRSPSIDCSGSYPYPSSSKNLDLPRPNFGTADEMKEWDDTRCPICMEIPHNTVLLKCTSYEKGCRPYMCNTSYRHSNCLDQFCKSFDPLLSSATVEVIPLTSTASHHRKVQSEPGNPSHFGSKLHPKLICPLCRGGIYGYMVSEPARRYMNCKERSCSSETCEFQGSYPELRKHARLVHPSVRPSEVDPSRQCDWLRMEQERGYGDLFSSINASSREGTIRSGGFADLMSIWFISTLFSDSRLPRVRLHDRRSETMHRVSNDTQTHLYVEEDNVSSLFSDSRPPRMPLHDRRSETMHSVSNDTQTHLYVEEDTDSIVSSLFSDSRPPRMSLQDRRSETMHRVSNDTQANQSARWRSSLPSTRQLERNQRIHRAGSRINPSSSRDLEANRTARWRSYFSPSGMPHSEIVENYYREVIPGVRASSTRMPQVSHVSHTNTNPWSNNSSSRRIPGRRLRWRNQRWSTFDSLP